MLRPVPTKEDEVLQKLPTLNNTQTYRCLQNYVTHMTSEASQTSGRPINHLARNIYTSWLKTMATIKILSDHLNSFFSLYGKSSRIEIELSGTIKNQENRRTTLGLISDQAVISTTLQKLSKMTSKAATDCTTFYHFSPHSLFELWHALDWIESQFNTWKQQFNTLDNLFPANKSKDLKKHHKELLHLIEKIYRMKSDFEDCNGDLKLYLSRYQQYILRQNRKISFTPDLLLSEGTIQSSGFREASRDYRLEFRHVLLSHRVNKISAAEALRDLKRIVSSSEDLSLELEDKHLQQIFFWVQTTLEGFNLNVDSKAEDTLEAFLDLCNLEMSLCRGLQYANFIISDETNKTGSIENIANITPAMFSQQLVAHCIEETVDSSFDEADAKDRKRLKEIEEEKRNTRQQDIKTAQHFSLVKQLELENLQKIEESKLAAKEKLLTKFKSLTTSHQSLLIDMLDAKLESHQTFVESEVRNILEKLDLISDTKHGFKITIENRSASTHHAHGDNLDKAFIAQVREVFSAFGCTAECLRQMQGLKASMIQ